MQFHLLLFIGASSVVGYADKSIWNCVGRACDKKGPFKLPEKYIQDPEFRSASGHTWDYKETDWGKDFPKCEGRRQSPVNIPTKSVTDEGPTITTINYDKIPDKLYMRNNGHTVTIHPEDTTSKDAPCLYFNEVVYRLSSIHFHWGHRGKGSEHSLLGYKGSVEMHMVHSADPGSTPNDKLVVAVIFDVDAPGKQVENIEMLSHHLHKVRKFNSEVKIKAIPMSSIFPPTPTICYTYEGSLTTPPCSEDVIFCVYYMFLPISQKLLNEFHKLRDEENEKLVNNYRPLHDLNGRRVFYSTMIVQT